MSMTKEEKEAIKVLEKYGKECLDEYKVEIDDIENIDEPQAFYLRQQIEAVNTVLNMLKEKDKEIEHWKKGFERELENNRKNTCELLKQDLIIREKDKQIDLMAKEIKERNYNFTNKNIKEIKQYFEKQAEQQRGDKDE